MTSSTSSIDKRDAIQWVSFYFTAHQDDWQLFMNPPAFRDALDGNTKCVFIHMIASDAGLGTNNGGRKYPFYLAREVRRGDTISMVVKKRLPALGRWSPAPHPYTWLR